MGNALNKTEQSQAFYWSLVPTDIITFILNILVFSMFVHFRKKLLKSSHNLILCSMSLADALVGIFGNNLGVLLLLKKEPVFYKLLGNIPMFSSLFVSILSLVLLTADRLIAIKRPHIYGSAYYRKRITRLIIATWIIPALIIVQNSLIFCFGSSRQELVVRSVFFSAFFTVGVLLLIVSNIILFIAIRRFAKRYGAKTTTSTADTRFEKSSVDHSYTVNDLRDNFNSVPSNKYVVSTEEICVIHGVTKRTIEDSTRPNTSRAKKKKRVSKQQELKQTSLICLLAVALFIVLWLPLSGYRFCYAIGVKTGIPWLRRLALCLTIVNSFCNPIIYLLVKKEFRIYMRKMVLKMIPKIPSKGTENKPVQATASR